MLLLKCITSTSKGQKKKKENNMARREKVKPKKDRKIFKKTAVRTKLINQRTLTPRGGIRL